jgi:ribosomal protein S18 acetylase RimI-like enzyme
MKPRPRNWCVESEPSKQDMAVVSGGVIEAGRREAAGGDPRPVACFLREDGKIVAGACGRTEFGRLFVDFLWVAEDLRRLGLGTEALERLEEAARERGARDALIETMSDRVAALYRRVGYREIATIEAYVGQFTKHVLLKRLRRDEP